MTARHPLAAVLPETVHEAGSSTIDLTLEPVSDAYVDHVAELRRFATHRMRDPVAAADVVQESYLRLALEARAGRYPRQPRSWLHRVVLNLIISGARQSASRRRALARAPVDDVDLGTPESQFLAAERAQMVGTAIQAIGARGRTGLLMAAMGYSGREIASTLGASEPATRALLSRARSRTRYVLALGEEKHAGRAPTSNRRELVRRVRRGA